MRSFAAAVALLWAGSDARANKGSCADNTISGKKSFSESRFEGRWYEIAKDVQFFDEAASCQNEDIVRNFGGSITVSRNSYTLENGWTQKMLQAVRNENNRGEYGLCDAVDGCVRDVRPDFYYFATDYEEWAVEYVCIDIVPGSYYVDSVSIKARTPKIDESTQELIASVIENNIPGYSLDNLYFISHCQICPFNSVPAVPSQ